MEQMLLGLARRLDALDESSLMALWEKYAGLVARFEPTRRWEEAALVLSFIQAKRWKNQLFNYQWARQVHASQESRAEGQTGSPPRPATPALQLEPAAETGPVPKGQVLRFQPKK
jgi:hypothetical protein